jgi:hypothetical protein
MMIEDIGIKREKIAFHGELKFTDNELLEDDCPELISRLVSWKLGSLIPARHFEISYNKELKQAEFEVFVSVIKPSAGHVETVDYIFGKLLEFIALYEKEFENITTL